MKKFTVLALAALLVVAFAMPASALENIFGGYWHTRFVTQKNFDGDNSGVADIREMNTRTRLFYTAKLNDKLKLINKFEFDTVWGNKDQNGTGSTVATANASTVATSFSNWGDVGADGIAVEIKNSYADFNVGPVNFLVGIQNFTLGRGFISNDDASGMKAIWKVNDGLYLPFIYQKMKEGGAGQDANEQDIEMYVFAPIIMLSKDIKIAPYYAFMHAEDGLLMGNWAGTWPTNPNPTTAFTAYGLFDNINVNVVGLDFDAKMGAASLWFTGIMQFGTVTAQTAALTGTAKDEIDFEGYLVAAGGKFDFGKGDVHAQAFYATGEEEKTALPYGDKEVNAYFTTSSNTYYWAEIMGGGTFDWLSGGSGVMSSSRNSPGLAPSNIMAVNLGATVKPMDKLSITADLWYAKLVEERAFAAAASNGNRASKQDELGLEVDLKVTYQLVEGLSLDIVGAYLFAGDATSIDGKNSRDPYEFGTQLSLSF